MIIGVTGNIGAGKTTATGFFPKSWKRISADKMGHALLHNKKIMKKLTIMFGKDILLRGKINRTLLAKKVFPHNVKKLNTIMHSALRKKLITTIKRCKTKRKNAVVDCALLHELKVGSFVDYCILITAPEPLRVRRTKKWTRIEIAQRSSVQKSGHADFIIANTGSRQDLKYAIHNVLVFLKQKQ